MAAHSDGGAYQRPTAANGNSPGRFVNLAGALVSLGLIVGIGVWGYRLVMRDVSGLPVVLAASGPMRISPTTPGGEIAPNIGLSVNEVAARGGAANPQEAEQVMLAPQVPDLPAVDIQTVMPTAEADEVQALDIDTSTEQGMQDAISATLAAATQDPAAIGALADALAAGASPMTSVEGGADVATAVNGVDSAVLAAAPVGVSFPRPQWRPGSLSGSPSIARAEIPTDASVTTDDIAIGTNLVQLGAFDSAEIAATEWVRFNEKFPDFMAGKERIIQQAERGGRTFFRLRAMNFADLSDARRFCAALTAEGSDCVPVVVR